MIGRILWIAALLGVAVVTAALQIDRQSERNSELAALVPGPLRNYAQTQIAGRAVAGQDPALALRETERLLRRRPIPAEYLTLRAAALGKAGKTEQAALAIQIAGQRGWRDPVAQEAVLRLALAAGDKAEAARRYMALLLRKETKDALLAELGPQVFAGTSDTARDTMVDIVVGGERWHSQLLRRGAGAIPPQDFAAIISASLQRGAAFSCGQLGGAAASVKRCDPAAAKVIVDAAATQCPELVP